MLGLIHRSNTKLLRLHLSSFMCPRLLFYQVWQPKEAANRYKELSSGWFNFWINEPLNASIVGDLLDEGKRELLGEMLKDQMAQYNMAPTVVAWDKVNGKVNIFSCQSPLESTPSLAHLKAYREEAALKE